jgi:hypothetical protein
LKIVVRISEFWIRLEYVDCLKGLKIGIRSGFYIKARIANPRQRNCGGIVGVAVGFEGAWGGLGWEKMQIKMCFDTEMK